jgi:hypothetical protein
MKEYLKKITKSTRVVTEETTTINSLSHCRDLVVDNVENSTLDETRLYWPLTEQFSVNNVYEGLF